MIRGGGAKGVGAVVAGGGAALALVLAAALIPPAGKAAAVGATPAGAAVPVAAHSAQRDATPPARLSETGLFLADGSIDPRNRPFEPQYPLWTDGATKSRWVRLPEGARIDVSDIDAWRFPTGTTFWKEFAWNGHRVETRMIRLSEAGAWTFATYVWNEAQTDAFLAPEDGVAAAYEFAPGRRHSIPGLADCGACHRSSRAVVLGFSALQLSDDRDPLAPHTQPLPQGAVTLAALVKEDRLAPARPDLMAQPPRIRSRDPVERAALGYLSGNCGGCHHPDGPLARLGFSLLHEVAQEGRAPEPGLATTADVRGRFVVPGAAGESLRIVAPGAPGRSVLLHRIRSRRPSSQMPPLGTVVADTVAVALVQRWIDRLRGDAPVSMR